MKKCFTSTDSGEVAPTYSDVYRYVPQENGKEFKQVKFFQPLSPPAHRCFTATPRSPPTISRSPPTISRSPHVVSQLFSFDKMSNFVKLSVKEHSGKRTKLTLTSSFKAQYKIKNWWEKRKWRNDMKKIGKEFRNMVMNERKESHKKLLKLTNRHKRLNEFSQSQAERRS
jgi:hypothetical protein